MGRGQINGEAEVIGASAGGRIWSNGKLSIPDILDWMTALHERMTANQINIGRSGLDLLPFGEPLERIPASTCMTDWPKVAYRDNPQVTIGDDADRVVTCLLDLKITDVAVNGDGSALTFRIGDDDRSQRVRYRLRRSPQYELFAENPRIRVATSEGNISIDEWFDEHGLVFFTKELDSFTHGTLQRRLARTAIRPESLVAHDWTGCDIHVEFDTADPHRMTVQRFLQEHLTSTLGADFIIFDHRSGEAADFIVGRALPGDRLAISLYHCKGAGGPVSGDRVDDVYELAGQAVKSARFQRKDELLRHIDRRTLPRRNRGHSPCLISNRDAVLDLVRRHDPIAITLSVHAVQPGLLASELADNVRAVMAAANDSLTAQGVELRWMVS